MKNTFTASILFVALSSSFANAGEFVDSARVISSTPIYEVVYSERQECSREQVGYRETYHRYEKESNGVSGSIIGGVAGGLLGNTVGKGDGKKVATAVGVITGAIVGDRIQNGDRRDDYHYRSYDEPEYRRVCHTIEVPERRLVGYDVVYKYQGREYMEQMSYDPGRKIDVVVNVVPRRR